MSDDKIKGEWEEHPIMTDHFVTETFDSKYGLPNDFCAWYMKKELGSAKAVLNEIKEEWGLKKLGFTFTDLVNNPDKVDVDLTESIWFDNFDCEYMEEYVDYLNEKHKTDKFYYETVRLPNDDCYFIICFKKEEFDIWGKGDKDGN